MTNRKLSTMNRIFSVLLSLSIIAFACDQKPDDPSTDDLSIDDPATDDPELALLTEAISMPKTHEVHRATGLDVREWRGCVIRNVEIHQPEDVSTRYLVRESTEDVLSGRAALRVMVEESSDPEKLAYGANSLVGMRGSVLTEPVETASDEELDALVTAPSIKDGMLEFWFYHGAPGRTLYRASVDLDELEMKWTSIETVNTLVRIHLEYEHDYSVERHRPLDVGPLRLYSVMPNPVPTGFDNPTYVLVELANAELYTGEEALRRFMEETSDDPVLLAKMSNAVSGVRPQSVIVEPTQPIEVESGARAPTIDEGILKYWTYQEADDPRPAFVRINLETLEPEPVPF